MQRIHVKVAPRPYDIVVGARLRQLPESLLAIAPKGAKIGIVSDSAVQKIAKDLGDSLTVRGFHVFHAKVPTGERSKTLRQAEALYHFCARAKFERGSWLVAVGGGVVGDLTGFVAATWLRGISYVQVPTTVLAQVDSSIGGKTGVDLRFGKNLVGAFHQPRLVWIDPHVLRTLPLAHLRNGMGEIIKYGAIADAALFESLEKNMTKLMQGYSSAWDPIIARCAQIKADVISRDPLEKKGIRALLNFGHSVGHAIEAATSYKKYLHGEAISIGMFVAAFISDQQNRMASLDRIRLGTLITNAGLPLHARNSVKRTALMDYLLRDKKVEAGIVRFVLLDELGKARSGCQVEPALLEMALSACGL